MNPLLLSALKYIAPYAAAIAAGGAIAWYVQGYRIEAANNRTEAIRIDFERYVTAAQRAQYEASQLADQQRKVSGETYARLQADLERAISRNDVYSRCISAGKCNGLRIAADLCQTGAVQTAPRLDATGSDSIPPAGFDAPVVNDCAKTTLQLNQLQSDIEKQAGY